MFSVFRCAAVSIRQRQIDGLSSFGGGSSRIASRWRAKFLAIAPKSSSRKKRTDSRAALGDRPSTKNRSEEHTSELQSLMRISYAVFCLKKKNSTDISQHKQGVKHGPNKEKNNTNHE